MLLFILLISLPISPAGGVQSGTRPEITPFFSRVTAAPAFWVECRNETGAPVSSAAEIWPWAPGRLRVDGALYVETGGVIGPGLSVEIEPGGLWRGIIGLQQSRETLTPPVKFDAVVRDGRLLSLGPGRHTVAVKCGDSWSEDYVFFWENRF